MTTKKARDLELDTEKMMLIGINVGDPIFTVSEVTKLFFRRKPAWLRWREAQGDFRLNGKRVGVTRQKGSNDRRLYTLRDVELMAHALAERGQIDAVELRRILRAVKALAQLHEYIK